MLTVGHTILGGVTGGVGGRAIQSWCDLPEKAPRPYPLGLDPFGDLAFPLPDLGQRSSGRLAAGRIVEEDPITIR